MRAGFIGNFLSRRSLYIMSNTEKNDLDINNTAHPMSDCSGRKRPRNLANGIDINSVSDNGVSSMVGDSEGNSHSVKKLKVKKKFFHFPEDDQYIVKNLPREERYHANAVRHLKGKKYWLEREKFCPHCWLLQRHCVCELAVQHHLHLPINVWILLHYKEYGRSTNTGNSLYQVLPNQTRIVIYGDAIAEKAMLKYFELHPGSCVVLYPSPDATTFDEFKEEFLPRCYSPIYPSKDSDRQSDTSTTQNDLSSSSALNILLLDSTWKQARRMARTLPPPSILPRLKLQPGHTSISRMRKQSHLGRVTTIEAFAYLLEEMKCEESEVAKLWKWINLRVEASDRMTGRVPNVNQSNNNSTTNDTISVFNTGENTAKTFREQEKQRVGGGRGVRKKKMMKKKKSGNDLVEGKFVIDENEDKKENKEDGIVNMSTNGETNPHSNTDVSDTINGSVPPISTYTTTTPTTITTTIIHTAPSHTITPSTVSITEEMFPNNPQFK